MNANQIFNKVFKGSNNFMTPDVLGRSMIGNDCAVELSEGTGIDFERTGKAPAIYGVTVVRKQDGSWVSSHDESKMFNSKADAQAYIGQL